MTKTTTHYYCDICQKEVKSIENFVTLQVPVFRHYDDTEFKSCDPYIEYEDLDFCPKCLAQVITLDSYSPDKYEFSR